MNDKKWPRFMDLKQFLRRCKIFEKFTNMDLMLEAYLTHESTSQPEPNDIPQTKDPVWILGKRYNALKELEEIRKDIKSRLWFSYRKGFIQIGDSGITSDKGWGCMLRCGQMVLAQALIFLHMGRNWKWSPLCEDALYLKILQMFDDRRGVPYSIHQIALTGASEGKQVGEWFGPNTVAQVLKKLTAYDEWNSLTMHVALDNVLVTNEVKRLCKTKSLSDISGISYDKLDWKPLLLMIPLRLGINEINPIYFKAFKACFTFENSLGIIGGKPNHALYFIGCVGDDVIYLDPHTTQHAGSINNKSTESEVKLDSTYHCNHASRSSILHMDPSVALCFLCRSEAEFNSLCTLMKENLFTTGKQPLFDICDERKENWHVRASEFDVDGMNPFSIIDIREPQSNEPRNSDDDYEFL